MVFYVINMPYTRSIDLDVIVSIIVVVSLIVRIITVRVSVVSLTRSLTKFGTTVPDRIFVKLRYVERIVLTAGSSNSYVFRGNSIFDPNYTSTGGQALATDQWNSFYQQYRVHSSSIKVVINATGGGAGSVRRYLTLPWDSDDLSTINATPFSVVAEYPRAKVWYGNTNTGAGAVSMSKNFVKSYKALGLI